MDNETVCFRTLICYPELGDTLVEIAQRKNVPVRKRKESSFEIVEAFANLQTILDIHGELPHSAYSKVYIAGLSDAPRKWNANYLYH